jgi:peptidoglycan L-alanyl-D-glutamate endopeptidase CwlK
MTDSNIADLCPELRAIYREWLMQCHAAGLAVKVICTWRSDIEQEAAKAKGFSRASAGESPHNCKDENGNPASKAFDFAIFDKDARYIMDGADDRYTTAGEIGEKLGLRWGGRFKSIFDPSHLELSTWRTS